MARRIGRYEVLAELGRGGFGQVYRCLDPNLGTSVAIKILTAGGDAGMMVRFRNEAATSRRLRHPNIVTIYDFGEQDGVPYIVMELLEGEDLHRAIETRRPLSLLQEIGIMSQMAAGLGHAHNEGIIHRDVKPANVMLLHDGAVKMMDFGIALITQSTHSRLTPRGAMIGTLRYMAPEQFRGAEPDVRSDIFAYGLIAYELLSGVHPFYATEAAAQMYNILNVEPVPISQFCPDCPPELQSILVRLLYKDPDLRYQSLDDVLADLEPALLKLRESRSHELIVEAHLAKRQNQLERAQGIVREALVLFPASEPARELREQLQVELRRQAVRPRVEELVKRAREAMAAGNPSEAAQGFESAIGLDPLDTTLQGLLNEARAAAERLREALPLLADADRALANGDASGAARMARKAVDLAPALVRAHEILGQAEAVVAEEKRRSQFAEDSAHLRRLIEVHSWQEASELLARLTRDFPDYPEVRILAERLDAGQKKEEDERKLAVGLAAARALFRDRDLPGALAVLESLAAEFPQSADVESLLSAVQLEIEAKRRRELVTRNVEEAQRLAAGNQFEGAIKVLDGALAQYPADPDLQRTRRAIVAASREAAWRSAIQKAITEAEELRSQTRYAEAVRLLDSFLPSEGGDSAIAALRKSIVVEQEAARRSEELRDVIRRANELIAKKQPEDATRLLKASPTHVRENSEVTRLREMAELQTRLEAEKQAAWDALVLGVPPLCDQGRFDEAFRGVDRFENQHGTNPEATGLRNRIRGNQQKAQRSAEELFAQATALIASNPLDATVLLGGAPNQLRERPEIKRLEQAAQEAAAEQRDRQAVAEQIARATTLCAERRFGEAFGLLEAGLENHPGQPELTKFRADVLAAQEREQRELSLRAAIKVYELKSDSEFENAERATKEALSGNPENPELLQLLADVRARHQQWRAEQAEQEKAQLRRETYFQGRQRAGTALRSGQFQAAITTLEELLKQFPDDSALKEDLKDARQAQQEQARREAYTQGRQRAGSALRSRQFPAATTILEELLKQFPDDSTLKEDLKDARQAQQEQARREAYTQGRQRAGSALRSRQFPAAVTILEELLKQFPDDSILKEDLKEASEAQQEQARREAYTQGRQRAGSSLRSGQFPAAITALEEMLKQFPDDSVLKEDLKDAREAQHEQARRERYATERRSAAGLVQARKFDDAIALLQTLLVEFPNDAVLEEDLKSTLGARDLQQQRETLNREVTQLERLYRKGDARAVQERASLLSPDLQDARVRELLDWARTELERPQQESERESAESLRRKRKQRIVIGVAVAAVVALAAGLPLAFRKGHAPPERDLSENQGQISASVSPVAAPGGVTAPEVPAGAPLKEDTKAKATATQAKVEKPRPKEQNSERRAELPPQQQPAPPQPAQQVGEGKGAVSQSQTVPKVVDCKARDYGGRLTGSLYWQSNEGLKPGDFLIIGGKDENLKNGKLERNFPNCEINFSQVTQGIEVVERPSIEDGYSRVKLRNSSTTPVSTIKLTWRVVR